MTVWTEEKIKEFSLLYPKYGKQYCIENLGLTDGQVRQKASRLGLKAKGVSEAWHQNNLAHSVRMTGRKRPEQALVMLANHAAGKLKKNAEQRAAISARHKEWIKANGHPRGALGLKHSDETKRKISEKSKAASAAMTDDQKIERIRKQIVTKTALGNLVNPRVNCSWKQGWREIGGVRKYYRSRWEANYARYLEWLRINGNIKSWAHEPKTFWFDGVKRGAVSYLPDFLVIERDGSETYHEVKGWMDDRSKTKIRRMKKYHPDVVLVVIDSKQYQKLATKVARMIDGWEE